MITDASSSPETFAAVLWGLVSNRRNSVKHIAPPVKINDRRPAIVTKLLSNAGPGCNSIGIAEKEGESVKWLQIVHKRFAQMSTNFSVDAYILLSNAMNTLE